MAKVGKIFNYCILFFLLVFILYSLLITKCFASDDFSVLRRVVLTDNGIFIKGFFRPLSDITLFFNYLIGGFNPIGYHLFNLVVHAAVVCMVFKLAEKITWIPREKRKLFAWFSVLLFLTYPFHNESVVWIVGRASLMATFFGVAALLIAFSAIEVRMKYFLVCVCYFVGLSSYESIFTLPAVLILFIYDSRKPLRNYLPWVMWLSITLIIHLIVRVAVSGVLLGSYGTGGIFSPSWSLFLSKVLKTSGRLFLPPMDNSGLLIILFLGVLSVIAIISFFIWRKRKENPLQFSNFLRLSLILVLSMLVSLTFSVSTRTFEGDRLFYFPSVFLAFWIANILISMGKQKYSILIFTLIAAYQLVFISINILTWKRASEITSELLTTIKRESSDNKEMLVVNIPEEYNGAYILRNGFYDALFLEGVDTSKIVAVNYVRTEQMWADTMIIVPQIDGDLVTIFPGVNISFKKGAELPKSEKGDTIFTDPSGKILYWDKQHLKLLKN